MWCFGLILMLCQTPLPIPQSASVACQAFRPIYWSASDTRKTKEQADSHNTAWVALCRPKGVKR